MAVGAAVGAAVGTVVGAVVGAMVGRGVAATALVGEGATIGGSWLTGRGVGLESSTMAI
jgi:hypothetical protein